MKKQIKTNRPSYNLVLKPEKIKGPGNEVDLVKSAGKNING